MPRFVATLVAFAFMASACSVAPQATERTDLVSPGPTTGTSPTPSPKPPAPTPTLVPVAVMPGPLEIGPQGAIVFQRTDDAREVDTQFIVNGDGTNERQLAPRILNGVWSPDARWLAFESGDPDSGKTRPAVMRADGSGYRVLDPDPAWAVMLGPTAWTADGKRLILSTGGKDNTKLQDVGLWSIRASDGGDVRRLARAVEPIDIGEFLIPSPDATRVLHNRIDDQKEGPDKNVLSIEDIDGTHEVRISPTDAGISLIDLEFYDGTSEAWSPDSQQVVFCVHLPDLSVAMYTARADGRGVKQLVGPEIGGISARFSPDGTKIAITSEKDTDNEVWVVNRDGTNPRQLTNGSDGSVSILPLWSPDGKSLVFQRRMQARGPITLWRVDVDGTNLMQLSATPLAKEWVGGYAWWPAPPG